MDLIETFNPIYSKQEIADFELRIGWVLGPCSNQLFDTIELEEFEDGLVTYDSLRGAFKALEITFDNDLQEYLLFYVYKASKNSQEMKYKVIHNIIKDQISQDQSNINQDVTEEYEEDFENQKWDKKE